VVSLLSVGRHNRPFFGRKSYKSGLFFVICSDFCPVNKDFWLIISHQHLTGRLPIRPTPSSREAGWCYHHCNPNQLENQCPILKRTTVRPSRATTCWATYSNLFYAYLYHLNTPIVNSLAPDGPYNAYGTSPNTASYDSSLE